MTTGDQLGPLRVRQHLFEARRECLVIEDLIFPSPNQQRGEFGLLQLTFEPLKPLETTCGVIKRNPARPRPGEKARSRVGQDAFVNVLRFVAKSLPVHHRQIHSTTSQRIVPAKKIRTDEGRVHHAPGEYPLVEFSRGKRPGPGTHDHERTDAVRIGKCKADTGRAAPIVTNYSRVANVELPEQACQVCDVTVEIVRLFADGFLGQAKPDHVWDNDPPAGSRQRLYEFSIQESPGGVAVQENNRVAGSLVEVVHAPAIDTLKSRFVWPFFIDKVHRPHELLCCIEHHSSSPYEWLSSWKEDHGLAVQAGQPRDGTEAISSLNIKSDDFVLAHTIEPGMRPKAQTPRLLKPHITSRNKHRTRRPSAWPYSRIVVTAFAAPKGCSLLTTILPFGAIARSSGLSSGSRTFHDGSIRRSESNARIVLSPSPRGPTPEARKSVPSGPNAKPRGNGTTCRGRTNSPALLSSRVNAIMVRSPRRPT